MWNSRAPLPSQTVSASFEKAVVLLLSKLRLLPVLKFHMTGDQSRLLKVGDRVCWEKSVIDLGTVVGVAWSGVTIDWDDGHTTSIRHNDTAQVERVPGKV